MRIAVLGIKTLPAFAGADRVVERLLENLAPEHEVTIYLLRDQRERLTCTPNRHYVYVPALRGKHLRAFSFFALCTLHFLLKGRARVVHVHNSDFGLFCLPLKLRPGLRIVGTFHGNPYERKKWGWIARAFLRISEWCFVRACDELTSVAASKDVSKRFVHHIPNGVQMPALGQVGRFPYAEAGVHIGAYAMFACGRLDATKGLHHLLDAYEALPEAPTLLVVGDFSHDSLYTQRIQRRATRDARVVLWPRLLDQATLYEAICSSRVFVFPSDVEAMSMVLLEALACQALVVCSDIPENIAVVGPEFPFLFRAGDAVDLTRVLARALSDESAEATLHGHLADITRRFRWSEIAAQYQALYDGSVSDTDLIVGVPG